MPRNIKTIAKNRKAFHDFHILETLEAGIVLQGTEVKSLREGNVNLRGSFVRVENGEAVLHGVNISEYEQGNIYNHNPQRPRKLLLHKREIMRLRSRVEEKGLTVVPLSMYFSDGMAKVEVALVRGKQEHDKRHAIADKDREREAKQAMKQAQRMF